MSWPRYATAFRGHALRAGYSAEEVRVLLSYAKRIHAGGLPIIYEVYQLSGLLGYSVDFLYSVSNRPELFYRKFYVNKKNGSGRREIYEPLPNLKEIQRWILDNILSRVECHKAAKAYIKGMSIVENARFHRDRNVVFTVDISNFFGSITVSRVFNVFLGLGYSRPVAGLLAGLCTLGKSLPQGAPTSPAISNLVCKELDRRLFSYAVKNTYRYTRYADDITLSGDVDISESYKFLQRIFLENGFFINESKTRVMRRGARQLVTGVVVNKKLNAPIWMRRNFKRDVYYIEKFGLYGHMERRGVEKRNYLEHLIGTGNFILDINPSDEMVSRGVLFLKNLKLKSGG